MKTPLLAFNDKGIYCAQADVYLDPWRPVDKAIISHGHADHSRWGHKKYITHHSNIPIIKHRLGEINVSGKNWNETFMINNVQFSFHPAGHIIGSAQIRVEYKGEVWVFTGDYKTEDDGVATPYEPVKCHTFITECTFGLPAFKWQPQNEVFAEINNWWQQNQSEGRTSVIFGYSLGKAQRLLKYLDTSIGKIYTHGAIENMTEVLRPQLEMPKTTRITRDIKKEEIKGNIVVAPPSAHGTPWIKKMVPYVTASASGWMTFRGARRRRAIDRGFVLSDHCDWQGLLSSIKETGAEKIICTHGYTDIFSRYLREIGYDARTEQTQYEEENAEQTSKPEDE
ncbi:MAG: DNA ligase-associated DEXH box helicase [Zunongwangia sp.]|uniref:Ligase-associated DNA damage response exonuclease n=1 Tax=Zunongwangia profunda TaxID=398743 RepID=A0A3D5IXF6_9FLAO|nr:ligase-associated DNA damage response exonuclease [Zunongwangia profunda]MAO35833.1 DNA ligase-associated DEXH box helicase [Zunongwangia sp.]MAS69819.1 DNA ligase-associated DEXH box helicase [Zunongwangia sp.]HAJ81180.1 DNA ligase-associated DEXH box helicase [Zunongwangia profunda]HCV80384.1 ligase-associated DNA damage response exonuclease [Zunongwangia profunda]|tara:strand:+ start:5680 stop:6696 length:1017 start_codon:yes stop_codon:yes gene_type:complete